MPKHHKKWLGEREGKRKKENKDWAVEDVVDVRPAKQEGCFECRIEWKNWKGEDTWEPRENLNELAGQIADRLIAGYRYRSALPTRMRWRQQKRDEQSNSLLNRVTPSPLADNVTTSEDSTSQLRLSGAASERKSVAAKIPANRPPRVLFDYDESEDDNADQSSLQTFSVESKNNDDDYREMPAVETPDTLSKAAMAQKNYDDLTEYQRAAQHLNNLPNVWPEEVAKALEMVGPPYGMQQVTRVIREIREEETWKEPGLFQPHEGMEVREFVDGEYFTGLVTGGEETVEDNGKICKAWRVLFEDGDEFDYTWKELLRCRTWRQRVVAPCRGRAFQCLELFSGKLW